VRQHATGPGSRPEQPGGDRDPIIHYPPFDAEAFALQTIRAVEFGDETTSSLCWRLIALEEIIAASRPRSAMLRRRLRRRLRESTELYAYAGAGFASRRSEQVGTEQIFDLVPPGRARS
jgi:hypothetical protein